MQNAWRMRMHENVFARDNLYERKLHLFQRTKFVVHLEPDIS